MPTQSKWQSLPTEAINPVSLAVDKARGPDIIEMHRERGPQGGRGRPQREASASRTASRSSRRRCARAGASSSSAPARAAGSASSKRPRCRRRSGPVPTLVQAIMAGGQEAVFRAKEGVEDNYEEGARSDRPAAARTRRTSSSASRRAA